MRRVHYSTLVIALACANLAACRDEATSDVALSPTAPARDAADDQAALVQLVRSLAAGRGVVPLARPQHIRPELVSLGQALAFDPILSGNKNISCMTCHMPAFSTGDGKSLSIGEGGVGFGTGRSHPNGVFIARNAPPLFNMGAMKHLFWDGRIQSDGHGGVITPAGAQVTPAMAAVFEFGPASAIAMFPPTNRAEMRGLSGNELAAIADVDNPAIWKALMLRLRAIPEYRALLQAAYPGTRLDDMTFAHASNAIGAFMLEKLTFNNSPWDKFLAGDDNALTPTQLAGAQTFLTLKCSICHTGATLSDDDFHNVGVVQIGPGEGDGASLRDDFGRMRVTGVTGDQYRFRTTPLRNVELTGPYGHDGAIASLRGFIEHYSDSDLKFGTYNPMQLEPRLRNTVLNNSQALIAGRDDIILGVTFPRPIVDQLLAYMSALTDDAARHTEMLVPEKVPSRLPVIPRYP